MMLPPWLLVMIGGAIGSLARFGLSSFIVRQVNPVNFPWGTFSVNIVGCALAGVFLVTAEHLPSVSQDARIFIVTGLLGGFTTFSAFGIETLGLIRRGDWLIAASYAGCSVVAGVLAMWLTYIFLKTVISS